MNVDIFEMMLTKKNVNYINKHFRASIYELASSYYKLDESFIIRIYDVIGYKCFAYLYECRYIYYACRLIENIIKTRKYIKMTKEVFDILCNELRYNLMRYYEYSRDYTIPDFWLLSNNVFNDYSQEDCELLVSVLSENDSKFKQYIKDYPEQWWEIIVYKENNMLFYYVLNKMVEAGIPLKTFSDKLYNYTQDGWRNDMFSPLIFLRLFEKIPSWKKVTIKFNDNITENTCFSHLYYKFVSLVVDRGYTNFIPIFKLMLDHEIPKMIPYTNPELYITVCNSTENSTENITENSTENLIKVKAWRRGFMMCFNYDKNVSIVVADYKTL